MVICPSDLKLDLYHEQELPNTEEQSIRLHLEQCAPCAARDAELIARREQLIARIRLLPLDPDPASAGSSYEWRHTADHPAEEIGEEIPGYQVLGLIHRGGQGLVYEAIQKSTRRRVAIKIINQGNWPASHLQARFMREVQILAQLRHPNIVTVHDSGVYKRGVFYVMDLVEGERLDAFIEQHRPSVRQTLEVFIKICSAVNSAHLLGVIHRDLKPGNVLVGPASCRSDRLEAGPAQFEPRVLDFGLAKLTGANGSSGGATVTETGQFVGSLFWASPEQAEGRRLDVRTDVYSIGVMLYQALTHQFPYPVQGPLRQVLHNINEYNPVRPSQHVREIDDEIDTIVMKCMSKDPERRYQNAGDIARDLTRYLQGQPITAKADSGFYVFRKALARHRAVTALSMLLIVSLGAFAISVSIQSVHLARARDRALSSQEQAERQRDELRRRAYVQQISLAQNQIETSQIDAAARTLAQTDPARRGWEYNRLEWLLDRSIASIDASAIDQSGLVYTPDEHIIFGDDKGRLKCWDVRTGRFLYDRSFGSRIRAVSRSMHANDLFVATSEALLRVDVQTGSVLGRVAASGAILTLAPPRGNELLWLDQGVMLKLTDLLSGQVIFTQPAATNLPGGIAISPDGNRIALANLNDVRIEDNSGRELMRFTEPELRMNTVTFSPDSRHVALATGAGLVRIWSLSSRQPELTLAGHVDEVRALMYSADGTYLVSGGGDGSVRVWDARNGKPLRCFHGHHGSVTSVAFSPDGTRIASMSRDGTVKLWDAAAVDSDSAGHRPGWGYCMAALSPNGRQVVATGSYSTYVWDLNQFVPTSPKLFSQLLREPEVTGFSPDGKRIFLTDNENGVWIYDSATHHIIASYQHRDGVPAAAYGPDGSVFVSVSWDHTAKVMRGSDFHLLHELRDEDELWDLAISHNSRWLATGGRSTVVKIWDLASGKLVRRLEGLEHEVDALAFSPDDRRIAGGAFGGQMFIWDLETGRRLVSCHSENGNMYSAVFTPDGRRVIVGTTEYVDVFDTQTGDLVYSFLAHGANIYSVELSADASMLLTGGGADGSFRIWPAAPMH